MKLLRKTATMVFKQDLDELKHVFLICAEFEVKSISM